MTQRLQDKQGPPHLLVPIKSQHPINWYKWFHPVPRRKRGCLGRTGLAFLTPAAYFRASTQRVSISAASGPPRMVGRALPGRPAAALACPSGGRRAQAGLRPAPVPSSPVSPGGGQAWLPRSSIWPGESKGGVSWSPAGAQGAREAGRQEKENLARPEREEVRQQKRDKRAAAALPPLCAFLFLSLSAPG